MVNESAETTDRVDYHQTDVVFIKKEDLQLWPGNARTNDVDKLRDLIRRNGFYGTLLVQAGTNRIVVGNHRFMAGDEEGMVEFPCVVHEMSDSRASRINVEDNKSSDDADWDTPLLIAQLEAMELEDEGLDGSGWNESELAELRQSVEEAGDPSTDALDDPADSEPSPVVCPNCGHEFELRDAGRV